jgi:hypothetical protein
MIWLLRLLAVSAVVVLIVMLIGELPDGCWNVRGTLLCGSDAVWWPAV